MSTTTRCRRDPSPYSAREFDTPDHKEFVKQTSERGHLLTFPTVRGFPDSEYKTVGGYKRLEAARRAGLNKFTVRVLDLDKWETAHRFVDGHIPDRGRWDSSREEPEIEELTEFSPASSFETQPKQG